MVMEARDRTANLAFFAAAAVVWVLVGLVVTTRDPIAEPSAGFVGAMLIGPGRRADARSRSSGSRSSAGIARSPTAATGCARSAAAAWVGIVVAVLVVLRLQGLLELPIALFIIAMVVVAEATLSAER